MIRTMMVAILVLVLFASAALADGTGLKGTTLRIVVFGPTMIAKSADGSAAAGQVLVGGEYVLVSWTNKGAVTYLGKVKVTKVYGIKAECYQTMSVN